MTNKLNNPEFIPFLLRSKRNTYAASNTAAGAANIVSPSRTASHDLAYQEGDFTYLDTYLGGYAFAGEEAVWHCGEPLWGMNYYGTMTVPEIPEGFGDFLKKAILQVPSEAPYRGPAFFQEDRFTYACSWQGDLAFFTGSESISYDGKEIYKLVFHGGVVI